MQNTRYLVFVPSLDKIIVSVQVVFNEIIPYPTDEFFAKLERHKIDVASESRDPADYQFLVGMQRMDNEDSIVSNGVSSAGNYSELQPREESTLIYIADVTRMSVSPACFRRHVTHPLLASRSYRSIPIGWQKHH